MPLSQEAAADFLIRTKDLWFPGITRRRNGPMQYLIITERHDSHKLFFEFMRQTHPKKRRCKTGGILVSAGITRPNAASEFWRHGYDPAKSNPQKQLVLPACVRSRLKASFPERRQKPQHRHASSKRYLPL